MPKDWKNLSDDEILNFEGPQTAEIARYERIMQMRTIEAMRGLNDRAKGLGDTIYRMHQGIKEKTDEVVALYERTARTQTRQQKAIRWLTVVIAVSTVFYTVITAFSVAAQRESNRIQHELLDLQKKH